MALTSMPTQAGQSPKGPDFTVRHLDWVTMANRWRMAWSFYRGGVHVLSPDHAVYRARFPLPNRSAVSSSSGEADSELPLHQSDFQWTSGEARSYIWKHDRETVEEFSDRSRRLYHLPLFRSNINNYVAGVLKQAPARRDLSDAWKTWHSDVDGNGTDIDALMRRALARALVFGRMHAIVDRLPVESAPVSKADERESPAPYCYLVSPLDLVDWKIGRDGQWDWVVIRRDAPDDRFFGNEMKAPLDWYMAIDRKAFHVFREQDENSRTFVRVGEPVAHGLGTVPMATLWATEEDQDRLMCCESPFADALDFNRHQLNKLSELDETERMQTFSILAWPTNEGAPLGELDIGQSRCCTYDAQAGAPSYIGPDASLATGKWQRIEAQTQLSRTLEGTSRGRAEYSKEERSAASMTVENEDKRNRMSWWASAVQEFDLQLHGIVAKFLGEKAPEDLSYTKDFDFRAVSSQVVDIVQLKTAGIPKKAIFVLAKGPVEKILRENGVDPEAIDKVLEDIDSEAEKPEPVPVIAAPFGGGPKKEPQDESTADVPA